MQNFHDLKVAVGQNNEQVKSFYFSGVDAWRRRSGGMKDYLDSKRMSDFYANSRHLERERSRDYPFYENDEIEEYE